MRKTTSLMVMIAVTLVMVAQSNEVQAAISNSGIFETVFDRYKAGALKWADHLTAAATRLFWSLATISMVWTFGVMALRKADISEFFTELLRFTITTGFFWWLLVNGPDMATAIYDSLKEVAAEASDTGITTPSNILDVGFEVFIDTLKNSSVSAPIDAVVGIFMAIAIMVTLALVSVNELLMLIAGWVLAYAGVFILGFGGSRWTSDMAVSYMKTVLGLGLQMMTMVLVVGIGKTFLDDFNAGREQGFNMDELAVMLIVALILLHLVNKLPAMVAGAVSGAGGGAQGIGSFGAGAAMAAASMAAKTAGAAMGGLGGMGNAVAAAFQKAVQDNGGADIGTAAKAMSSLLASGGSGGADGGSGGSTQSPFSAAAGFSGVGEPTGQGSDRVGAAGKESGGRGGMSTASKAGRIALDTAANLVKGAGRAGMDAVSDSVADSMGSRIAEAIRSMDGGGSKDTAVTLGDNEIYGDADSVNVDAESEISAFVNRERG
jgi:type IV secretion system protein VirB6/type IV secretion system protein TrbL